MSERSEAEVCADLLRAARDAVLNAANAVTAVRRQLGQCMPVVVNTAPEFPRAMSEALEAHENALEPLANALARLTETRAHLALAGPAVAAFVALREKNHAKLHAAVAERRAESGEKPS